MKWGTLGMVIKDKLLPPFLGEEILSAALSDKKIPF